MREPPVSRFISRATPQASGDVPVEPRAVADRAPAPRAAGTQQPREMDAALFNLSEPAQPRDASPTETASFVPASHVSAYAQQPEAAPVLDDFDRLIASEMAAMGAGPSAAPGVAAAASFDYDIAFTDNDAGAVHADAAYEPESLEDYAQPDDDPALAGGVPVARRRNRRPGPVAVGGGVKRGVTFVSGVAGVALISIVAAIAWNSLFGSGGSSGEPLVIAADTQPYKTRPEDPGGREIPNQNKAVYQRDAGQGASAPTQEALIASEEEPVDISAEDAFELPGVAIGQSQIPLNDDDLDARMAALSGDGDGAASSAEGRTGVLEPRRVRTVEVRPDGTIVGAAAPIPAAPAPEGVSPAGQAPADEDPMAALIASATAERDALAAGQVSLPASMPAQPLPVEPPAAEALPPEVSVVPTPAPARRPAPSPGPSASAASTVTALAPEPRPAQMPAAPTGSGFYVQLSAQPSEAQARQALRDASLRYANILSGSRLSIQTAAVENRGTFYRVRAEAPSYAEAEQVCSRLQRAGAECFVTR
ncbi:SPOR domain-containing protein [Aureimonas sp. OT7]|uniref:SPOR domain-containing protein n=1 Tax=Aureimonas sp. OT7 TaxID=2816454 RepID=UPI001784A76E|nr:SPOR domain-containing protein [Aureimonas sp. OT7]QOG05021.1 SPOR domain-containing protein [Aureimonas sp. OT7]